MKPDLLTTAKAALEVLEMLGEGALVEKLRAAIAEAEKQEPVLYMDNRTDVVSPALRHTRKGYDTPLYLHPAPTVPEWQPIATVPDERGIDVWIGSMDNHDFGVRVTNVHRVGSRWFGIPDYYNTDRIKPTHWMPLPDAPKQEDKP